MSISWCNDEIKEDLKLRNIFVGGKSICNVKQMKNVSNIKSRQPG